MRSKERFWKIIWIILIFAFFIFIGIAMLLILDDPSRPLYWKFDELLHKRKIELIHDNVDEDGIQGIFMDLEKKYDLPEELYLQNRFSVTFDEDGEIEEIYTFFYGKDENGKEHTYLIDYDRDQSSKMTIWLDNYANTSYAESMKMQPMLEMCQNTDLRSLNETSVTEDGLYKFSYYGDKELRLEEEKEQLAREKENEEVQVGTCVISKEDGSYTYFLNDELGWRLTVVDAAAGSRWYKLEKSENGGNSWKDINLDPFLGDGGVADGLVFFDENYGYISMGSASQEFAEVYVTNDGGVTFAMVELPKESMEVEDITLYDYMFLPSYKAGKTTMVLGMDAYQQEEGAVFYSLDQGVTWEYEKME